MAYLKEIYNSCAYGSCVRPAQMILYNWRNALLGQYCRRHGNAALADQQKREEAVMEQERLWEREKARLATNVTSAIAIGNERRSGASR